MGKHVLTPPSRATAHTDGKVSLLECLGLVTGIGALGGLGGGLWWLVLDHRMPRPARRLDVWMLVGGLLTAGGAIIVLLWLDVRWYAGVAALICYLLLGAYLRLPPSPPKRD